LFRSRASLEAEILILRHQLDIQRRQSPKRLNFSTLDRLIRGQGVFFAFQSWAGCITNIFGFDLRQAQAKFSQKNDTRDLPIAYFCG